MGQLIHRRTFHAPIATAFFPPPAPPPTRAQALDHQRLAFIAPGVPAEVAATGLVKPDRLAYVTALCAGYTPSPWRIGFNLGGFRP